VSGLDSLGKNNAANGADHADRKKHERLPAGAARKPVQIQDRIASVPQPGCNFACPKRAISRAEVAIEQLCDFFSRTWPLDLVQRPPYGIVETVVQIWGLTHLRLSGFRVDLLKGAHFPVARPQARTAGFYAPVGTSWRINLRIASGSCSPEAPARVYVRSNPFGPSTRISQFSVARDPAMNTRQSPRRSLSACSMLAVISFDS
jgi:hypothetical protein